MSRPYLISRARGRALVQSGYGVAHIVVDSSETCRISVRRLSDGGVDTRAAAIDVLDLGDPTQIADAVARACAFLAEEGAVRVFAPMHEDGWGMHRLVLESDGSPAFLREPVRPEPGGDLALVVALRENGFDLSATYISTLVDLARVPPVWHARDDVQVMSWDADEVDRLVSDICVLASEASSGEPVPRTSDPVRADAIFGPLLPFLDPRLVLFARTAGGELLGCAFGYPDLASPARNAAILELCVARRPGLTRRLVDAFHDSARSAGFSHVIHALMREDDRARARKRAYGARIIRRHGLLSLSLTPRPAEKKTTRVASRSSSPNCLEDSNNDR